MISNSKQIGIKENTRMRARILLVMIVILLIAPANTATVSAGCDPWGTSTLLGNAQYPPGWFGPNGISIHPSDEYVFGVIDGSATPQQFSHIKTKLQYYDDQTVLGAGKLMAVAMYRKRTDYQPDMSTDPPTAASVENKFSMSISSPVAVGTLPLYQSIPVSFDFTKDPIPAGITDLTLTVFFYGANAGEENQMVLKTGIIDLNEPMHLIYWNLVYEWALFGNVYPLEDLMGNHDLLTPEQWDQMENQCGFAGYYFAKYAHHYVGFGGVGATSVIPVAYIEHQSPGQYSRLIVLTGPGPFMSRTYIKADGVDDYYNWKNTPAGMSTWEAVYADPNDYDYRDNIHGGVVNQFVDDVFSSTDPITFGTLKNHFTDYYIYTCPSYSRSEIINLYQGLAPDDLTPFQFTILNFP